MGVTDDKRRNLSAEAIARQMFLADRYVEEHPDEYVSGGVFLPTLAEEELLDLFDELDALDPRVAILPHTKGACGWPENDNGKHAHDLEVVPMSRALSRAYATDALFTQYASSMPKRLNKEAIGRTDITVAFFVVDGDCDEVHGTTTPAPDRWFEREEEAIATAVARYPGAVYYRTRGGFRLMWRLPRPVSIASDDGARTWRAFYLASLEHLRSFGVGGDGTTLDPALASWNQHVILPDVPKARCRGGAVEGPVWAIGAWNFSPNEDELARWRDTKRSTATRVPGTAVYKGDPTADDPLLDKAQELGLVVGKLDETRYAVVCPRKRHEDNPSQTVLFRGGGFKCLGADCGHLRREDFRRFVESRAASRVSLDEAANVIFDRLAENRPTVIVVPCGVGKSTVLRRKVALAPAHVATLVPTHALAREQDNARRVDGLPYSYAHHAAVTRETNARPACARLPEAETLERQGLSVRALMCPTCPQRETCEATKEPKGDAHITVHALAGKERFRRANVLVIDEQFGLTETVEVSKEALAEAWTAVEKYADKRSSALLAPWVEHLRGLTPSSELLDAALTAANSTWKAGDKVQGRRLPGRWVPLDVPRVVDADPRALADCADRVGRRRDGRPRSERAAREWVREQRCLAALTKVRRTAVEGATIERDDEGRLSAIYLTPTARAWRDRSATTLLSATPLLPALRALRADLELVAIAVPDGPGGVHRTHIRTSDTHVAGLKGDDGRLRHYLEIVVGRARAARCSKVLIVVASTFETKVAAWARDVRDLTIEVTHFGPGLVGLDRWKDFDGFATIGENWGNKLAVEREAAFLGVEPDQHKLSHVLATSARLTAGRGTHGGRRPPITGTSGPSRLRTGPPRTVRPRMRLSAGRGLPPRPHSTR